MSLLIGRSAAIALAVFALHGFVEASSYPCPASAEPAETSPAPPGWRAWRSDEARTLKLRDVTFSDGQPEQRTFIRPVSSSHGPKGRIDKYDFASPTFQDIWLICQYEDTRIALVKQTDIRGKRCQVTYTRQGPKEAPSGIFCN
jgi:hypothetical protein